MEQIRIDALKRIYNMLWDAAYKLVQINVDLQAIKEVDKAYTKYNALMTDVVNNFKQAAELFANSGFASDPDLVGVDIIWTGLRIVHPPDNMSAKQMRTEMGNLLNVFRTKYIKETKIKVKAGSRIP